MLSPLPGNSFITLIQMTFFLGPTTDSAWSSVALWSIRLLTLSFFFRTFLGPSILRLISKQLRVRTVSLRSIRGLYFRSSLGVWHVERIGISYRRRSEQGSGRFSVKVEGLRLELQPSQDEQRPNPKSHGSPWAILWSRLSPIYRVISLLFSTSLSVYSWLDPYTRPIIRAVAVATFRFVIRALPVIVHALDLELDSGVISLCSGIEAKVILKRARLDASIIFDQLEVVPTPPPKATTQQFQHRRFTSVANFNIRLRNSLMRTWDRAWGSTEIVTSTMLVIERVVGSSPSSRDNATPEDSSSSFLDIPHLVLTIAARVDPHQGIQRHSLDASVKLDPAAVDLDNLLLLLRSITVQRRKANDSRNFSHTRTLARPILSASVPQHSVPATQLSPATAPLSGWSSPMGALSTSIKFRRNVPRRPVRIVNSAAANSRISVLRKFQCTIPRVAVQRRVEINGRIDMFSASFEGIDAAGGLSQSDRNSGHREWLGRGKVPEDPLSAEVYYLRVATDQISVKHTNSGPVQEHLQVAAVGSLSLELTVSGWPSPWLHGPTFMAGDPNAQWLILKVVVEDVGVTERLEVIEALLTASTPHQRVSQPLPSILSPIPRFQVSVGVGRICARLISPNSVGVCKPFAIEARSGGLVVSGRSEFFDRNVSLPSAGDEHHGHLRLRAEFGLDVALQRTFVTVCGTQWGDIPAGPGLHSGQPLVSLDELFVNGSGCAFGYVAEEPKFAVTTDLSSAFLDIVVASEALSIELWQPDAIAAVGTVLRTIQTRRSAASSTSPPDVEHTPVGLSISFALNRIMLFITGPDLSPGENLELSRGVASHVGVLGAYCFLRAIHNEAIQFKSSQTHQRQQLSLNVAPLTKAALAVSKSDERSPTTFVQVKAWDIAVRDALATRLVADDLFGVGDTHHHYRQQEYLNITQATADILMCGPWQGNFETLGSRASCEVLLSVGAIKGTLHLANVYNALLAIHTLKSLSPSHSPNDREVKPKTPALPFDIRCEVDKLALVCDFPLNSKVYLNIDAVSLHRSTSQTIIVGWNSLFVAASMEIERYGKRELVWEEIIRLLEWRAVIQPDLRPIGVVVEGHSALIRIPFQFVLADLILDLNVSMKCTKHLFRMVPSGRFSTPDMPGPEEAKKMPDLVVRVGSFIVEAADEDMESRLALIWNAGEEASRLRLQRDEAFQAKVAAIIADGSTPNTRGADSDYQFSPEHSISIGEAQARLHFIHSGTWKSQFRQACVAQYRRQDALRPKSSAHRGGDGTIRVNPPSSAPPLFRITLRNLSLHLTRPSFSVTNVSSFLAAQGGLPCATAYSLLLPMHLNLSALAFRVTLREYPLPLLNVPPHSQEGMPGLIFDTDLVIAEEMGEADNGVEWVECAIVKAHRGLYGASPLSIAVPKTLNPVKTYANPVMRVTTDNVTDLAWGISYSPAMQDFMRVIDTLSHSPRDSSPAIGFWDKLRLVFHWSMKVYFSHEVHLHLKGSRSPHDLRGAGAGFALCWRGDPHILIGQPNEQNELIQVMSDTMLITIPDLHQPSSGAETPHHVTCASMKSRKVCAKLVSGVRFGVGIVLERACGLECLDCTGTPFRRRCRFFTFKPHYQVMLERKEQVPLIKSPSDSYNGFRSDFIHMSISLTSSIENRQVEKYNSIHLSPKLFSHFWAWWTLFDTASLPIRQGRRYKHKRPLSPKFGQHLATIKYRISVPKLFISHAYMDESSDAWTDGVTPFVGSKARIDHFQADMHQRAQESTITTFDGQKKTIMHKPFVAVEVVLKRLELRALLAIFSEPLKRSVPLNCSPVGSAYRNRKGVPVVDPGSPWVDSDDFVETDWSSSAVPALHLLPVVSCPRFTYFRRAWQTSVFEDRVEVSKFDNEDSHVCLLGTEPSVPQVQLELTTQRIKELRELREREREGTLHPETEGKTDTRKMITLLEDYVQSLAAADVATRQLGLNGSNNYYMPSDSVSPEEWAGFDNVYQVHSPQIFMDNIIRDILIQYYYCSVARRGVEYHMATRAVKFIRDQAKVAIDVLEADPEKRYGTSASAQIAAAAVRKMFIGEIPGTTIEQTQEPSDAMSDPMAGWSEGVSLRKSHFCLLLKPQIVLRSEASHESVVILAAVQGKLRTYAIMDVTNAGDPVSGKVMTRNFASITGLQSFSPSTANASGEGCVPLEVLVDLRCDNSLFDRLVPQTDASFHYDKFNRLRLRNNVTSVARTTQQSPLHNHLRNQTDLLRLHVPRFTVSANDRHFQAISNIVTDLLLFSNAALKTRSERLGQMLFSYDFANVSSAADVVADLQSRLRQVVEMKREAEWKLLPYGEDGEVEKLKINAHILLLSEELDFVFDAIKLAQDKVNNRTGQNSSLLLHASSAEISWRMLDRLDQLLVKLAVRNIDFQWLTRQDSSVVNRLVVGDLQAFDGAADAEWTEILSKFEEKSSHPLVKQKIFLLADWTVLPPVGGIAIYEAFDLNLHPMSLQIDTRVGTKIMEYVWPARRARKEHSQPSVELAEGHFFGPPSPTARSNIKRVPLEASPTPRRSVDSNRLAPTPLRKLHTSRSFTDLHGEAWSGTTQIQPLQRTKSSDGLFALVVSDSTPGNPTPRSVDDAKDRPILPTKISDDAAEMKTRSSQKTFVWVRVSSLHLILSIMKEDSFLCREARIKTRDLEYRNQTWSFEELFDQFIPSGRNWKGWVKMAFQQPLVPVLPVAKELITKTKWGAAKPLNHSTTDTSRRVGITRRLPPASTGDSPHVTHSQAQSREALEVAGKASAPSLTAEPESIREGERDRRPRTRVLSLFKRSRSKTRSSVDSDVSMRFS